MCKHGTYKTVKVINSQNHKIVKVDACIADEIQFLNDCGVVTLGCCCGHGRAGTIVEWENVYGKWKGYADPPKALIRKDSADLARKLGYRPYPYYYADGESCDVMQMELKTGCLTEDDVEEWHKLHNV